ncbi:MAG: HD domain-containing protein, partial [Solobacterium sp.]|nr:HD domain-containing protein [Solobacterium sp.]
LRAFIANELRNMEDMDKRDSALLHLNGVSLAATLLAEKRGLDSELAAMAGLLHDMAAYRSGSYDDHAHRGAEYAGDVLHAMGETTEDEIDQICSMIYHHDDKQVIDSPLDEVLKDADVIHHCFNDLSKPVKDKEKARFNALIEELGLTTEPLE